MIAVKRSSTNHDSRYLAAPYLAYEVQDVHTSSENVSDIFQYRLYRLAPPTPEGIHTKKKRHQMGVPFFYEQNHCASECKMPPNASVA